MEEEYYDEEEYSDESEENEEESEGMEEVPWKQWFLSLKGNEFFADVDNEFIEDDFNLTGLSTLVPYYDFALDTILDVDISAENLTEEQRDIIDSAAEVLYGLIHARFILSVRGMEVMHTKYTDGDFGRCPRFSCNEQHVLPIGDSDMPRVKGVLVFCPKCREIFFPRSYKHSSVDGAFFGTTFCHLYLLTHPAEIPAT